MGQRLQQVRGFAAQTFSSRECWLVACAIGLAGLSVQLMNRALFPLFDGVFTYARDISVTFSALVAIAVGLVSLVRPGLVRGDRLTWAMLAMWAFGLAGTAAGLALRAPVLLAVGACLFVAARGWSSLSSNLAAVSLPPAQAVVAIAVGAVISQALDLVVRLALPQWAAVAILTLLVPVSILCVRRPVAALADQVAAGPTGAELAVTRPASYLPFTSNLYVCLILVQVAFGFALRFGETGGAPSFGNLGLPFAVLIAAVCVALLGRFVGDEIVNVSLLALTAGFLLVIVGGSTSAMLANGIINVGTCVFGVALNSTLVALAARNHLASMSIVGWGQGLSGLATTLGALLGTTANALDAAGCHRQLEALVAGLVLALVAYVLFGLRGFSLKATIEGVVPPEPACEPQPLTPSAEESFAARCHELACAHGLTPREEETFSMLARGRDRAYIEERLGVSRNTVKAHVKHVYAKLGIHSHQELIDLVEE